MLRFENCNFYGFPPSGRGHALGGTIRSGQGRAMQARGTSIIEMVIAMAIAAILLSIATLSFQDYLRRYQTEAQTRLLFSELLKARVNAICQRRTTRLKIYPTRFEVYSSQCDDAEGVEPLQTHLLRYPITWTGKDSEPAKVIEFQMQGLTFTGCSICLEPSAGSGAVDSIKISTTRVSIGKKDKGNDCDSSNITQQ